MQPEVTEMLTLKMLKGTRGGLKDPSSILLSQKVATALFGSDDPMNKTIKLDNKQLVKVKVVHEFGIACGISRYKYIGHDAAAVLYIVSVHYHPESR